MNRNELIELYYEIGEAVDEKRRLGEFDANAKYIMVLLDGLHRLIEHAIEQDGKVALLPPPDRSGK